MSREPARSADPHTVMEGLIAAAIMIMFSYMPSGVFPEGISKGDSVHCGPAKKNICILRLLGLPGLKTL